MKKMIFFVFIAILIGCSSGVDKEAMNEVSGYAESKMADDVAVAEEGKSEADVFVERKLIKNAVLRFETNDLSKTAELINAAIKNVGGYISSDETHNYSRSVRVTMVVRVPAKQFDTFIESISEGVKRFDVKQISSEDVTTQFIDIAARLRVKKETELRYLEILKQATSVKDILDVENQIQQLRSEIESLEGRMRYLTNQIDFSTVSITYSFSEATKIGFLDDLSIAGKQGGRGLYKFFIFLVRIWPLYLILIPLFLLFKFVVFKRKKDE